jgi:hypothetical protein
VGTVNLTVLAKSRDSLGFPKLDPGSSMVKTMGEIYGAKPVRDIKT